MFGIDGWTVGAVPCRSARPRRSTSASPSSVKRDDANAAAARFALSRRRNLACCRRVVGWRRGRVSVATTIARRWSSFHASQFSSAGTHALAAAGGCRVRAGDDPASWTRIPSAIQRDTQAGAGDPSHGRRCLDVGGDRLRWLGSRCGESPLAWRSRAGRRSMVISASGLPAWPAASESTCGASTSRGERRFSRHNSDRRSKSIPT